MICALLVLQTTTFEQSLDLISPWLDMLTRDLESVRADLDAQTHRRFIKTHTPFDGLPHHPDVTYICVGRDPRTSSGRGTTTGRTWTFPRSSPRASAPSGSTT